jgi:hypothetical protein
MSYKGSVTQFHRVDYGQGCAWREEFAVKKAGKHYLIQVIHTNTISDKSE